MSYNFKVYELGNGEIQICSYPNFISSGGVNYGEEDIDFSKSNIKFIEKYSKSISKSDSTTKDLSPELKEKYNMLRSVRRSKDSIYKLALCNEWDFFCTFTFDNENFRYDYSVCIKRFRKWLNNQKSRKCPDLIYLFIVEPHKDGAYHLHGLIKSKYFKNLLRPSWVNPAAFMVESYRFGISDVSCVEDPARVSNYITKYVTKDLFSSCSGRHRYFCSRDIKHPVSKTFNLNMSLQDFIETYYPDLDLKHTYLGLNDTCYLSLKSRDKNV